MCGGLSQQELQLAAISDFDCLLCGARLATLILHGPDYIHAINNGTEDDVLAIQPRGLDCADEELRPIGIGAGIGHGEGSRINVLQGEVLVFEFISIN